MAPWKHESLCYAHIRVVHSWIRTPPTVAFHIEVQPTLPVEAPAPAYLIEKTYRDLVMLVDRLTMRAQGLASPVPPAVAAPDAALFEAPYTPWHVAERNSAIDRFLRTLQQLPVWYDDLVVLFLTKNTLVASPNEPVRGMGPSLRQAFFLHRRPQSEEWEWQRCSLYPRRLVLQTPTRDHVPQAIHLPHTHIRRQFEDAPGRRLGKAEPRCSMLVLQASPHAPFPSTYTLAMESNTECNEWLQALLEQTSEMPAEPAADATVASARTLPSSSPRHDPVDILRPNSPRIERKRFWYGLLGLGHGPTSLEWPPAYPDGPFGIPLAAAVQESGIAYATMPPPNVVPAIVLRCIEFLEHTHGVEEEGIYRISGSSSAVKALCDCFVAERDVNLETDHGVHGRGLTSDPHTVSGVLKTYLRALPERICPDALLPEMLRACEIVERSERAVSLAHLTSQLPDESYALLRCLCAHFVRIHALSAKNKMTCQNLSIVLSPALDIPAQLLLALLTDHETVFAPAMRTPLVLGSHIG